MNKLITADHLTPQQLGAVLRTCRGEQTQAAFAREHGERRDYIAKAEAGLLPDVAARLVEACTGLRYRRVVRYELELGD
ncbi:MAG: hypothetical protein R3247_01325 [Rhodothermales bacterium]|nr:hypothetical protein [Rhodothermales bacterium]